MSEQIGCCSESTDNPVCFTKTKDMEELQEQLRNGTIERAYRALLFYMLGLRTHLKYKNSDFSVSALYQAYMDMPP